MTATAPQAAALDAIALILQAVGIPAAAIEKVSDVLRGLATEAPCPRTRARNEPPSGDKISFDQESWVRLHPRSLEGREDAQMLDQAIATMRPDLPQSERWKVWRDFCHFNIEKAKSAGKIAKARRLRDLFGFAMKWRDRLSEWQDQERRHRRQAYRGLGRVAMTALAAVTKPEPPVLQAATTDADKILLGAVIRDQDSELSDLSRRLGGSRELDAHLVQLQQSYGVSLWKAKRLAIILARQEKR